MALQDHLNATDKLQFTNATKQQQIDWLCQIIKKEVEKPDDEVDYDLIQECTDFLEELMNAENPPANLPTKEYSTNHHNPWLKAIAVVAATLTILFTTVSVVAKTQGFGSAWEFVSQNVDKILKMKPGDTIEQGDITLIKGKESIIYPSIEELVEKENLNILYPSKLPENVRIQKITQQYMSDDSMMLSFQTNDPNLSFSVSTKASVSEQDVQHFEVYKLSNIIFYIDTKPDGVYHAIGYYEDYEYQIIYNNYDALISIIDNMKGHKQ